MTRELSTAVQNYIEETGDELLALLEALCRIPAPSHHEEQRADFCLNWLKEQGAEGAYIDEALNVVYPVGCEGAENIIAFLAHTDTVFPDTDPMPVTKDDTYIYAPGVGDDTTCLSQMLMVVKYIIRNKLRPNCGILFVANSCEEGLGNLKGVRQIMKDYAGRIRGLYTFDGDYRHVVDSCVGSHRYRIEVETEGGHSFGSFGNKNAIHYMAEFICGLYRQTIPQEGDSRTTYNVGIISGGTSVNTIAQNASMLYEYRSDSKSCLAIMKQSFETAVEQLREQGVTVRVELIGERPCSGEVDRTVLEEMVQKCISVQAKHSGYTVGRRSGSTDCNVPMSLGVPAVCVGTYEGSGTHTRQELVLLASLPVGMRIAAELILDYFHENGQ